VSLQVTRGCDGAGAADRCRRYEVERAMRPVRVVVIDEDAEHVLEVSAVEDQEPVEALSANGADEARPRSPSARAPVL
jgi:hypothetical protein